MNFILFAIISGGIYFKEFSQFKTINWIGFILGVMLLFTGIYLLSPNAESTQVYPEDNDDFDDGNDGDDDDVEARDAEDANREVVPVIESQPSEHGQQAHPLSPGRVIPPFSIQTTPHHPSSHHTSMPSSPRSRSPRTPTNRTPRRPHTSTGSNVINPNTLPFYSLIPPSLRMERRRSHEESTLFEAMNHVHSITHVLHTLNARVSPQILNRRASSVPSHDISPLTHLPPPNSPSSSSDMIAHRPRSQSLNRLSSPIPMDTDPIAPMMRIDEVLKNRTESSDGGGQRPSSASSLSASSPILRQSEARRSGTPSNDTQTQISAEDECSIEELVARNIDKQRSVMF
jgi:hypothetical protein